MKEPFLVRIVVLNNFATYYQEEEIKLPLKKINQMYTITKERFIRFLEKKSLLQPSDSKQIHFEFFDKSQSKFKQEKQVFDANNNLFSFPQEFFGKPETLEIKLVYEINYWNIKGFDIDFLECEEKKEKLNQEQQKLMNELDKQKQLFQEMKEDLNDIYDLAKEQIKIKKKKEVDIVVLYSSPLIQLENNIEEALFIDYEGEIKNIEAEIKSSGKEIEYEILLATRDNLDEAMRWNPQILHLIINGDYDLNSGYYFELQEGSLVEKLTLDGLIQILSYHQRKLKRLRLICISSMIAKDIIQVPQANDNNPYLIENVQNFQSVTFVGQVKFFNQDDNLGNQFWRYFYKQLIENKSFKDSYDIAKKKIDELFKVYLKENPTSVKICCCFHEHDQECLKDPAKIGYTKSHQLHLKCSKQRFNHLCGKQYKSVEQCEKGCLGQIYHDNEDDQCQINEHNCNNYESRFDDISVSLNLKNNQTLSSEILNINIPIGLQIQNKQKEKNVCCCFEYHVFQNKINDNYPINQNKYQQKPHQLSQKFVIRLVKGQNQLDMKELLSFEKKINYLQINKQIIIIHSQDCSKENFSLLIQILKKYFEKYYTNKNLELITLSNEDHPQSIQELIQNVNQFCQKYLSNDKTFKILILSKIDNYCKDEQFKQFYENLLDQFQSKENLVIIIEASYNNIRYLKQSSLEDFFQLINYDEIKEQLNKLKCEKQ
ncbi:unnamed protein product [Paramecium octaurelia]|uniref:Uncharacterized protein n=1 Tax=Paramecium octaurelia TaxID=43137 RepID=A0A8S1VMP6_PAROT|nr:unnamed protein product [Paramecium octaurelia]